MLPDNQILRALNYLNDKHIARILVCSGPGVVLHKLAVVLDAPSPIKTASMIILGAGVVLYAGWNFAYKRLMGPQEDRDIELTSSESDESADGGQVHADLMKDIVLKCNGDALAALALVESEILVNPETTYLAAIELAHRRKEIEISRRFGN